jgi:hypothetical protein
MKLRAIAALLAVYSFSSSAAGYAGQPDQQLQKFKSLTGPQEVAVLFNERFHGRSLLFWKRSSEVWLTEADARFSFEQDFLISSVDPDINHALVTEIRGNDVERSRYAVFLLCLRARFVPHSEFLIKQVVGDFPSDERNGLISPFPPDLNKLDKEATQALSEALGSPNAKLRNSTKIYTFALLKELSSLPTTELAERWREASRKVPACLHGRPTAYSDDEQAIPILRDALVSRGLEAAVAISSLLKSERNPESLKEEINLERFLDSAAVRLHRSEEGRQVIQAVKDAVLTHTLQYCGMRMNRTEKERQEYWLELERQFLRDRVDCSLASWAQFIVLALNQQYGDHITCGIQMQGFLSRLADIDPAFPAWEFPSTGTQDDMLHPDFESKIRCYHEMWIKMKTSE